MPIRFLLGSTRISDAESEYVSAKILKCRKLLSRYSDKELTVEVEIRQDKKGFWNVKAMIKTPHELYRISKKDADLFKTADMLEEALLKKIRRNKEKIRDLRRSGINLSAS